jgi:hypothetical protein
MTDQELNSLIFQHIREIKQIRPPISDDEWRHMDALDELEAEWTRSQQRRTEHDWLNEFPEARPILIRETKRQIKNIKDYIQQVLKYTRDAKNSPYSDPYWQEQRMAYLFAQHENLIRQLKSKEYQLRRLEGEKENPNSITPDDIRRAKESPLLAQVATKKNGTRHLANCPFHNEDTPSFTIYSNNTFYCFGCGVGGDVIDFIMRKHEIKFLDAVRMLINK